MKRAEERRDDDVVVGLCIGTVFLVLAILFYPDANDNFYRSRAYRSLGLAVFGVALFGFAAWAFLKSRKRAGRAVRKSRRAKAFEPRDNRFTGTPQPRATASCAIEDSGTIGAQAVGRISYIARETLAPTGTSDLGFEIVARSTLFSKKLGAALILGGGISESGGCHSLKCYFHPNWLGMERCPSISSSEYEAHVLIDLGNFKPLVCSTDRITYLLRPSTEPPRRLPQVDDDGTIQFPNGQRLTVAAILADVVPLLMALNHWDEWVAKSQRLVFAIPPIEKFPYL